MNSEQKRSEHSELSVCSFKLEESVKRRFSAAMRAEGTTMSERIRKGILLYMNELDAGVEHPQFRLDLVDHKSEMSDRH